MQIKRQLHSNAVVLRIVYDSQEAVQLSAFCPIQSPPCLVIIDQYVPPKTTDA